MNKPRVLFVYPNPEGYGGVPNGLAILSGYLKNNGIETDCFDTTFYNSPPETFNQRAKHGFFKETNYKDVWGEYDDTLKDKIPQLFADKINEFKPDLIAISHVDICVKFMDKIILDIKNKFNIPIVAGGITCTSTPEVMIKKSYLDMICIGEGEQSLLELINRIYNKEDYSDIKNLWVKKDGKIIKNELRPFMDMNKLGFQDWDIFDKRHYYKPYCGRFWITAFVEMARGCHFNCTYCVNSLLRKRYKDLGNFMRLRDVDIVIDEICFLKEKHGVELVFFIDDNFLGMPQERFDYFCEQYQKRVNLPFWIQSRSEMITEYKIKKLKEIGVSTISIGLEHGCQMYREKYMNRYGSDESIINAFDIVNGLGIRTTANLIVGMPYEKEEMMEDTINILKRIKPSSVSMNFFLPFSGTVMRQMALDLGLINEDFILSGSVKPLEGIKGFSSDRIRHYYENLKKYVSGELVFNLEGKNEKIN